MNQNNGTEAISRPKIAVVIGSGSIRSLAALPLLEFLKNKHIPIDMIIGTGGGATVGALFAAGFPSEQIPDLMSQIYRRKIYNKFDYLSLLQIAGLYRKPFSAPPAPYKGKPILDCYNSIFKDLRLEDLPYKMVIEATNLMTGKLVDLSRGLLAECLYASNASYPFYPPIELEGQYLAGGVYTSAFPLLTSVISGMDIILAVNVSEEMIAYSSNYSEYLAGFFACSCRNNQISQTALAIDLHEGQIFLLNVKFATKVKLRDVHLLQEIIEAGERTLNSQVGEIEAVLGTLAK